MDWHSMIYLIKYLWISYNFFYKLCTNYFQTTFDLLKNNIFTIFYKLWMYNLWTAFKLIMNYYWATYKLLMQLIIYLHTT